MWIEDADKTKATVLRKMDEGLETQSLMLDSPDDEDVVLRTL